MIQLRNIAKTYAMEGAPVRALRGVTLQIQAGEFTAIMGPSGSGKSTLMHILGLLDQPDEGIYLLGGRDVSQLPEDELAALRNATIGFVFQHFNLLPRATALENVTLPMLYSCKGIDQERARKLLADFGLGERLHHRPCELSGGQQQRVAIARALASQPALILADEPTGNLDSASAREILDILKELNRQGLTVVIVTHDADVAAHARRIIQVRDGQIQNEQTGVPAAAAKLSDSPVAGCQLRAPNQPARRSGIIKRELLHHFRQAWRALNTGRLRTLLSVLGILIGVAAVITMMAIGTGARKSIEQTLSSLGSNLLVIRSGAPRMGGVALAAATVTRFTQADAAAMQAAVESVLRVSGTVWGRAQVVAGNRNWNTQVTGVEPNYAAIRAVQPMAGRFITPEDEARRARVAVIGLTVARELFGSASPLGEYIRINKDIFQVVGILRERGANQWHDQDDIIIVPLATAMYRLLGRQYLDSIEVEVRSAEEMEATREALSALIVHRHRLPADKAEEAFTIRNMAEIQATMSEAARTMEWLLASIAIVSIIVGGIGIMNIMLVSVTERTREIGVRKAVGAQKRDILGQFLTEAVCITLGGGILGILIGLLASHTIASFADWTVAVTWPSILLAFACAFVAGMVFGLWPAWKAARLNPIDALRYE